MASAPSFKIGQRTTLRASMWKGVLDLSNPYAVPPTMLAGLHEGYIPEPKSGGSPRARMGFQPKNLAGQLGAAGTRYGQGIGVGTDDAGVTYNFVVVGGKVYRVSADLLTYTDVSPTGITIATTTRVYITPFSNRILVNDGVNPPWIGSALSSTPITGTLIDYTGDAAVWVAYGPAAVYDDAAFFVVRQRSSPAAYSVVRVGWSLPDDPTTGFEQTNYDYEWDVIQNGTNPIYALYGDNLQLTYFRNDSIGYLSGVVGSDFQTTAAHDAVADATGTRAPASIAPFGESSLFFVDEMGRPQWLTGGNLVPIWEQMERVVTSAPTGWVEATARMACGQIVPQLNLYVVAIWSPDATQTNPQFPTVLYVFDAKTGIYLGEWAPGGGIAIHAVGTLIGEDGEPVLVVLGSAVAPTGLQEPAQEGGFVWALSRLEDGAWADNDVTPNISVTLSPNGYSEDLILTADSVSAVVEELQTNPYPTDITLDPTTMVLVAGAATQTVTAEVRNAKGGFVTYANPLTWASSNSAVATVAASGTNTAVVTMVAAGTANITASLVRSDGTTLVSEPCVVTCSVVTVATGGTITQDGLYRVHTFTAAGIAGGDADFIISDNGDADYPAGSALITGTVVGGGGGGEATDEGSGGGGGGVQIDSAIVPAVGSTTAAVGAGGAAGADGSDSTFGALTGSGGKKGATATGVGGTSGNPTPHSGGTAVAKAQDDVGSADGGGGGGGAGTPGTSGVISAASISVTAGDGGDGLDGYGPGGAGGATSTGTGSAFPGNPGAGGATAPGAGGAANLPGVEGIVVVRYLHPA